MGYHEKMTAKMEAETRREERDSQRTAKDLQSGTHATQYARRTAKLLKKRKADGHVLTPEQEKFVLWVDNCP